MGVSLNFGFNGFVAIRDMNGKDLYQQSVRSKQEATQWIEENRPSIQMAIVANQPSVRGWEVLKSSLVPVRINNREDLLKDLFLPTFINHVLKIKNLFIRILISIVAVVWDMLTLPVRLIALPIKFCCSRSEYRLSPVVSHLPKLIQTSPYLEEAQKNGIRFVAHAENTQVTKTIVDPEKGEFPIVAEKISYNASRTIKLDPFQMEEQVSSTRYEFTRSFPSEEWIGGYSNIDVIAHQVD